MSLRQNVFYSAQTGSVKYNSSTVKMYIQARRKRQWAATKSSNEKPLKFGMAFEEIIKKEALYAKQSLTTQIEVKEEPDKVRSQSINGNELKS